MDKQNNIALSKEARSENTSGDRLKELAALNDKLAQIVASNVSAPPELLAELINRKSKTIRKAVISNPNTPVETLFKLGVHYFPQELLNNPTFQLLYLENPDSVKNIPFYTLHALLQIADIPPFLLNYAQKGYQRQMVVEALAMHVVVAGEMSHGWHEAAEQNAKYQIHYFNFLGKLDFDFLSYFIEFVPQKIFKDKSFRMALASNSKTPPEILEQLAQDQDSMVRAAVANKENLPSHLLKQLAKDEIRRVRSSVANNPNTPIEILKVLARDKEGSAYYQAVKNPRCNLKIRENIFKNIAKSEAPSYLRFVLFLSDYAESSVLAENSNSISWLERYAIAQNPKTPTDTLKQLAQDGNRIVRAAAKESLNIIIPDFKD
ncbi:MAG: hypothetical protein AAGA80_04525 [Cyanobacteria bacterium P01_F01_bin.143]